MENRKVSSRVLQTRQALEKALLEMMAEHNLEQLTVKELCERAGIHKQTFYRHYQDLNEFIVSFRERAAAALVEEFSDLKLPEDLAELNRRLFLLVEDGGPAVEKLLNSESYHYLLERLSYAFLQPLWMKSPWFVALSEAEQRLILRWIFSTGSSFYVQWLRDGKPLPLEQAIALSGQLLCQGLGVSLAAEESPAALPNPVIHEKS